MLRFNHPFFFFAFLLIIIFFILKKTKIIKRPEIKINLLNWQAVEPKRNSFMKFSNFLFHIFFFFGISFIIIALTEPIAFKTEAVYTDSGNSIMFLIDVSPSMAAKDMSGESRLNSAKNIIKNFVDKYPGDSFGLSALGSSAALIVPPTIDHKVFLSRLDSLSIGELGDGTALGMGLAVSSMYSKKNITTSSHIILLTDGENNTGEINPKTAAKFLLQKNINFFIIGIGNSGYTNIEYTDKKTGKKYKGTINSKFNPYELKKIASYAKGKYASADSQEILQEIFNTISEQVPATQSTFNKTVETKLYRYFLNIAIFCFVIAWFIRRIIMGMLL